MLILNISFLALHILHIIYIYNIIQNDSENEFQDVYYILYENNKILKDKFINLNETFGIKKHKLENANFEIIALKEELEKLRNRNRNLEIENSTLIITNDNLEIENPTIAITNEDLTEEVTNHSLEKSELKLELDKYKKNQKLIETLTKEHDDLSATVLKFIKGKENLDVMLSQQIYEFNKEGLGYLYETSQTKDKGLYHVRIKEKESHISLFTKCSYCNRNGHSM